MGIFGLYKDQQRFLEQAHELSDSELLIARNSLPILIKMDLSEEGVRAYWFLCKLYDKHRTMFLLSTRDTLMNFSRTHFDLGGEHMDVVDAVLNRVRLNGVG
ncbi:MAG: hypothetical protein FWH26_02020 [Oscillospiraceae bacterium]|nr:hypothetical protein [Oscillospiraceae bacterium]